jgi:hypothetical protein
LPGAGSPTSARCRALEAAGGIAYWSADPETAHARYLELLELSQRIGDRAAEAVALFDLFHTYGERGEVDRAFAAKEASQAIFRNLGDSFNVARVEHMTALILLSRGALEPSEIEARASQAEALGDPWLTRLGPTLRGYLAFMRGDVLAAGRLLVQSLRGSLAVRELTDAALGAQFFVVVAPMIGRPEVGAMIHGACQAAFERMGIRPPATYEEFVGMDPLPGIEAQLGADAFAAALDSGRRMSIEEAVDLIEEVASG